MAATTDNASRQEDFHTVYRGRLGWGFRQAYQRQGKVLAGMLVLREASFEVAGKSVFDFGFGTGSFFLALPRSCRLTGIELDSVNVDAVTALLTSRGYASLDLRHETEEASLECDLLAKESFDLVILSHVLEHMIRPVDAIEKLSAALKTGGKLLVLLPINEKIPDPRHEWIVDRRVVEELAAKAGQRVECYREVDHLDWFLLPLRHAGGWRKTLCQAIGLMAGMVAQAVGARVWFGASGAVLSIFGAKPAQAAFLLCPLRGSKDEG